MPNLTKSQRHNKHLEDTMAFYRKTTKECPDCRKLNYYEARNCFNCNRPIADVNTLRENEIIGNHYQLIK